MEYAKLGHSGIDVSRICVGGLSREAINREIDLTPGRLGTDYLDMMIIHSPQPWVDVNTSDDRFYEGNIEAYCALEDALSAGKLRAIGVSNFLQGDLQNILGNCSVVPAANQVLCHVLHRLWRCFCVSRIWRQDAIGKQAVGARGCKGQRAWNTADEIF